MKFSAVVTTCNRRQLLERCLRSLATQTYPPQEYEIVVVADGCTDATAELLSSFAPPCGFRFIEQENRGQPAAQNVGVASATGEYIVFIDDDCVCDPGLLAGHEAAHRAPDQIAIGAVKLHPETPPGTVRDVLAELYASEFARWSRGDITRADLLLCANSSIRRDAALQFPFDESYGRIHDVEAGSRLWAAGYRPAFAPDAVLYERFIKDERCLIRDSRNKGKYEVILVNRRPEMKPHTGIVRMNEGSAFKRALRKRLAIHWRFSEALLGMSYGVANALRRIWPFGAFARRILKARAASAHLAGAIDEAGSWEKLEACFGRRVPVLMYHNVGEPQRGEYPGLTTPTAEFELQLRYLLKKGYKAIRPADWLAWRNADAPLPPRPVMLVFDDAYREAAEKGFPVLQRYGFPAACMVVSGYVGGKNHWDKQSGLPSFDLMCRDEILAWADKGIDFGGHSHTHPDFSQEPPERVAEEISRCRAELEQILGEPPAAFAYPYGKATAAAHAEARKRFAMAFTTFPGILHLGADPHLVPRISFLPGETRIGMWFHLHYGTSPYEFARNCWRRLTSLGSRSQSDL